MSDADQPDTPEQNDPTVSKDGKGRLRGLTDGPPLWTDSVPQQTPPKHRVTDGGPGDAPKPWRKGRGDGSANSR